MAKAQFQNRRMTQGPFMFIIMIPIGAFLILVGFDFFYKMYNEYKLLNDAKTIMKAVLDKEGLETPEDYNRYAEEKFYELGYEESEDFSLVVTEDEFYLVVYSNYFSMINEITFKPDKIAVARVKGFYNEYKEPVIVKYVPDENQEEDLIEEGNKDIIIK